MYVMLINEIPLRNYFLIFLTSLYMVQALLLPYRHQMQGERNQEEAER